VIVWGRSLFLALLLLGTLFVAVTMRDLPPLVATNFNGAGAPHAWMSQDRYLAWMAGFGILLPMGVVGVISLRERVARLGWWLGCVTLGFALGIHYLILLAHRTRPPHLSTPALLAVGGVFLAALAVWAAAATRAMRPPPQA